ncbi:MAG: hypothetical protein HQ577_05305 [Dehalococcoidia bacterium]|nr:hypothetical protein [Dehalococcoidia bacterium]
MSKKMKVLIAVLVAILTLTVSGTVAVLAQENEEPEPEEALVEELEELIPRARLFMSTMKPGELLSRLADRLGISEEELNDAFAQAKEDIMAERGEQTFDELLDRAVEEGLITEEEAAEIADWWEQKPEAFNRAMLKKAFSGMCQNLDGLTDEAYGQLKEMRRNTWQWRQGTGAAEGSAGETRAWKGNKSAALNQTSAQPRIMQAARGRQMIAVSEGWQGSQQCQAD